MMTLTPAEAIGTYNGLALAGIMQESLLGWVPRLLILYGILRAGLEFRNGGGVGGHTAVRTIGSILVLVLFWPGLMTSAGRSVAPSEFISAAAQSGGGTIQSAADSANLVAIGDAHITELTLKIVEFISEGWLNLALATRQQALRPFSQTMPLQWLFSIPLNTGNVAAIRDWTEKCVIPAQGNALRSDIEPTYANMLPFSGTPVGDEMGSIIVRPGRFFGTLGAFSIFAGGEVSCSAYSSQIISGVSSQLQSTTTASGKSVIAVWAEEGIISAEDATQALIMKEVLRTTELVPAPSLRGEFATFGAISAIGAGVRAAGNITSPNVGLAAGGAVGNQIQAVSNTILGLIGPALIVTEFAPLLLGLAQTIFLAAMPIVLIWVVIPGRQAILIPVTSYFVILSLLYSSPMWWAVLELASETSNNIGFMSSPAEWAKGWASMLILQTIGIGVVIISLSTVVSLVAGAGSISALRSIRR